MSTTDTHEQDAGPPAAPDLGDVRPADLADDVEMELTLGGQWRRIHLVSPSTVAEVLHRMHEPYAGGKPLVTFEDASRGETITLDTSYVAALAVRADRVQWCLLVARTPAQLQQVIDDADLPEIDRKTARAEACDDEPGFASLAMGDHLPSRPPAWMRTVARRLVDAGADVRLIRL